ncbi:lysozyme inhibitor LprI family protein [Paraburkholderia acidicola]|uniref:Lysozyme inhibitor LprI family protein n=1 Tax=Paraburkholderia acidicola TaxID=1912599 RepID=A0ABV1LU15_9BURK
MMQKMTGSPVSHAALALAVCVASAVWSTSAHATSFDCKQAATHVEQAICTDASLGDLDSQLAETYKDTQVALPDAAQPALQADQRKWLAQRNACAGGSTPIAACLRNSMSGRFAVLSTQQRQAEIAFDRIVASIPSSPAQAASQLAAYKGGLASAWLDYLHQFEPASGVTAAQAKTRERMAIAALTDDDYMHSIILDLQKDPKVSRGRFVLTLLRMQIERAYVDQRPYVHCFVFERQGEDAYAAMGSLYGSTRDGSAPLCAPTAGLFDQPAWKQLGAAFKPMLSAADATAGTIRFASYTDWAVLELRATLTPLEFLAPAQRKAAGGDPAQDIRKWSDDKVWPRADRERAIAALGPARQVTATWLHDRRGLPDSQADEVARIVVSTWVHERLEFAD